MVMLGALLTTQKVVCQVSGVVSDSVRAYTTYTSTLNLQYRSIPQVIEPNFFKAYSLEEHSSRFKTPLPTFKAVVISSSDATTSNTGPVLTVGETFTLAAQMFLPRGTSVITVSIDLGPHFAVEAGGVAKIVDAPIAVQSPGVAVPLMSAGEVAVDLGTNVKTQLREGASDVAVHINGTVVDPRPGATLPLLQAVTLQFKFTDANGVVRTSTKDVTFTLVAPSVNLVLAVTGGEDFQGGDALALKATLTQTEARAAAYDVRATFSLPANLGITLEVATPSQTPTSTTQPTLNGGVLMVWDTVVASSLTVDVPMEVSNLVRAGAVLDFLVNVSWRSRPTSDTSGHALWQHTQKIATIQAAKPRISSGNVVVGPEDAAIEALYAVVGDSVVMEIKAEVLRSTSDFAVRLLLPQQVGFAQATHSVPAGVVSTGTSLAPLPVVSQGRNGATGTNDVVVSYGNITNSGQAAQIVLTVTTYLLDVPTATNNKIITSVASCKYDGTETAPTTITFNVYEALISQKMTLDASESSAGGFPDAQDTVTCVAFVNLFTSRSRYFDNAQGKFLTNGVNAYNLNITASVSPSLEVQACEFDVKGVTQSCSGAGYNQAGGAMTLTNQLLVYDATEKDKSRTITIELTALVSRTLSYEDELYCLVETEFYSMPEPRLNGPGRRYSCTEGDTTACFNSKFKDSIATPFPSLELEDASLRSNPLTVGADVRSSVRFVVTMPEVSVNLLLKFVKFQGAGSIIYDDAATAAGAIGLGQAFACDGLDGLGKPVTALQSNQLSLDFGRCSPTQTSPDTAPRTIVVELFFVAWDTTLDNANTGLSALTIQASSESASKVLSTDQLAVRIAVPQLKGDLVSDAGPNVDAGQSIITN